MKPNAPVNGGTGAAEEVKVRQFATTHLVQQATAAEKATQETAAKL